MGGAAAEAAAAGCRAWEGQYHCRRRRSGSREGPSPPIHDDILLVECLMPLRKVVNPYPSILDFIVVRLVESEDAPINVMQMALVRDCLTGNGC